MLILFGRLNILLQGYRTHRLVIFWGLEWNFIDAGAFRTLYIFAHSKSKTYFALATSTYDYTIERITFTYILARSAYIELSVSWDRLRYCTKVTSYFTLSK